MTQLAEAWLQQALRAFPWLLWHAPLSTRLAEVWDAEPGGDKPGALAGAVLKQVGVRTVLIVRVCRQPVLTCDEHLRCAVCAVWLSSSSLCKGGVSRVSPGGMSCRAPQRRPTHLQAAAIRPTWSSLARAICLPRA